MEDYHTEKLHFSAAGDPFPSDVLISVNGGEDHFRSTTEDIFGFLSLLALKVLPDEPLKLKSTQFEYLADDGPSVMLTRLRPMGEEPDMLIIIIPLDELQDFARQAMHRHLVFRMDSPTFLSDAITFGLFNAFLREDARRAPIPTGVIAIPEVTV